MKDSSFRWCYRCCGLCQQLLNLLIDVLTGEAELLIEHLVRSREAEALETPNGTVGTYQTEIIGTD